MGYVHVSAENVMGALSHDLQVFLLKAVRTQVHACTHGQARLWESKSLKWELFCWFLSSNLAQVIFSL